MTRGWTEARSAEPFQRAGFDKILYTTLNTYYFSLRLFKRLKTQKRDERSFLFVFLSKMSSSEKKRWRVELKENKRMIKTDEVGNSNCFQDWNQRREYLRNDHLCWFLEAGQSYWRINLGKNQIISHFNSPNSRR